jgi:glycosyltransferase involved in cell wall biosynthesis
VVLPARMLWDKGVGVLVDAARILHPRVQVQVALVGEPDSGNPGTVDPGILRQWHAEGVVEWRGWRSNMEKIYQESHIVTLPTTYGEGVPTVLLEAAACGRPLVASDTPGCRQVVQDGVNGFLVPPNDPQALAEALERLVCDPELRGRMGAAGRELVLQKFTHAQINAATLDVYARLLRSEI